MSDLQGMRVLITGATGLVGSALAGELRAVGAVPVGLVRDPGKFVGEAIAWDPLRGQLNAAKLEGFDAVVNLAGESIAAGRWTEERKRRMRESRVKGTALLAEALPRLQRPPRVFLSASAAGYYGCRGDEVLGEEAGAGSTFLAGICRDWEAACEPLRGAGVRVVNFRLGMVLSREGGALAAMLPILKTGLGGRLGEGKQWWSWIHLNDVVGALAHALREERVAGAVNFASPNPVRNVDFTRVLAQALHRPALLPAPKFGLRLALGEMADEMLLCSARLSAEKLVGTGYAFKYAALAAALRCEFGGE